MKRIFLSLFSLVPFFSVYGQSEIVDFLATVGAPVNKKICITDVIYKDGKFDAVQERIIKGRKLKQDNNVPPM